MSGTLRLRGATSGYSELQAPAVAADQTFVLPTAGGTLLTTDSPVPQLTLELGSASEPSLRFEGDTDTGLFSQGTNTLNLVTGGSSKVVLGASAHTIYAGTGATVRAVDIDSSGNVGVGVTSNLAGSGDLSLQGNKAVRWAHATDGTQYADIYGDTSSNLVFRNGSSSTEQMRIDSLGRVGIGCTPASGLQLKRATPELSLQPTADTQTGYITFINSASSTRGAVEYSYASDYMAFKSAGSERMRVASNGRVGIGETSPDALLHLNFTSGNPQLILERSSSSTAQYGLHAFSNTFTIKDEAQNEERLRIDSAGKVGIGTTSPNRNLTVFDSSNAGVEIQSGTSGQSSVFFTDTADTNIGMIGYYHNVDAMFFRVNDDERMRIDSSGNVGIGTTAPLGVLHTSLNATDGIGIYLENRADAGASDAVGLSFTLRRSGGYQFAGTQIKSVKENAWTTTPSTINSALHFSTYYQESAAVKMRLTSGGNLYVGDSTDFSFTNYTQTSGQGNWLWRADDNSSVGGSVIHTNRKGGFAGYYFNLYDWVSGEDLRWFDFYKNGATFSRLQLTTNGNNIELTNQSDYRLKQDVEDYTGAIELVKQLKPKTYNWISNPTHPYKDTGFLAHEVQEIFPDIVNGEKDEMGYPEVLSEENETSESNELQPIYQSLDMTRLIPTLTAALKEAIEKIESLETRIATLENN